MKGKPVVGVFATNHQPQVLLPYFATRKKNPAIEYYSTHNCLISMYNFVQKPIALFVAIYNTLCSFGYYRINVHTTYS
jgi:hypothetical protein